MAAACPTGAGRLLRALTRRKDLDSARSMDTPLSRCLTTRHLIFASVSLTCGVGIFVLVGNVLREKAGPAGSLSILLASGACIITSQCYMELCTLVPRAGSGYAYTYLMLGELPAYIIGWSMMSEMVLVIAAGAKAFSGGLDSLAHGGVTNFTMQLLGRLPESEALAPTYDLPALALTTLLCCVNMAGAMLSMSANLLLGVGQCLFLLLLAAACFAFGSVANWTVGGFAPFGLAGVVHGAGIGVFAISGFEVIGGLVEETKDPARQIPRAFTGALAIITSLYALISLGLSYLTPYYAIDVDAPFVVAFAASSGRWMSAVAAFGITLSIASCKLSAMFSTARLLYAMGTDGLLFACFGRVHPSVQVPHYGVAFTWLLASLLAVLLNLETLANMVSLTVLLVYGTMGANVFVLRVLRRDDDAISGFADELLPLRPWAEAAIGQRCGRLLANRTTAKLLLLLYVVCCVGVGGVLNLASLGLSWWTWPFTCVACGLVLPPLLLLLLLLCLYEPRRIDGVYVAPLTSLTYLATIFVNLVLMMGLPAPTWLRFVVWTIIGLLLYFTYGFWYSKEARRDSEHEYQPLGEQQQQQQQQKSDEKSSLAGR